MDIITLNLTETIDLSKVVPVLVRPSGMVHQSPDVLTRLKYFSLQVK